MYSEDEWGNDFTEIEPTRVSMQTLLNPSHELPKGVAPLYSPQEYNYARMDEIRARKVEERERKRKVKCSA